jgi:5'-3' exonuclease
MIIVDYSGIAMGTIFSQHESKKTDLPFIRHLILNSLRMYNMKYRDKYGEMILACDGGSWRRQYFPQYKASRRQNREESSTDWKAIFEIFNAVKEEIAEYLPWRVLQVQHAEADDIIATLV